jgi:hypothetical protein
MEKSSPGGQDLVDRSRGKRDYVAGPASVVAAAEQSTPASIAKSHDAERTAPSVLDPVREVKASAVWERAMKKMQQTPGWTESLGKLLQPQEQGKEQYDLLLARLNELVAIREIKDQCRKVWIQIRDTALATMKAIGDLGTAVTALNPYAALAWGTL